MARKRAKGRPRKSAQKGSNSVGENSHSAVNLTKGHIPLTQDARRTRTIEEVQGIPVLEFSSVSVGGTPRQQRLVEVATPIVPPSAVQLEGNQMLSANENQLGGRQWFVLFPINGHDL